MNQLTTLLPVVVPVMLFMLLLVIIKLAVALKSNKKVQSELKESEAKFRSYVNNAPDGIFVVSSQDICLEVNKAACLMTGYSENELLGQDVKNLIPKADQRLIEGYFQTVARDGRAYTEITFVRKDGDIRKWSINSVKLPQNRYLGLVQDITGIKLAEKALKESEAKFRNYVENASDIIFTLNTKGIITYISPNVKKLRGYEVSDVINTPFADFIHPDNVATMEKVINYAFEFKHIEGEVEYKVRHQDGTWEWYAITGSVTQDVDNEPMFIGISRNITERKRYEQQLEYLSLHDKLTGLYNRALFETEMKRLAKSRDYPITILSCDLDGLKIINDTMGHNRGDELIRACGELFKKTLRGSDVLARIGGDEFAAILPKTDKRTAEYVVERIQQRIDQYNKENQELPVNISIGIATTANNQKSLEQVLKEADERMYHEKLIQKQSSRSQIIDSLLAVLAEKDYITEGHSQRLARLSTLMGKRLNLPSNRITDLNLLAKVHDLGKVGIPDNILLKNGPLTEEEWAIMRQHSEKGYRIAIVSPDLAAVADLILKHHEHWDGSGYPLGLLGTNIPIECRILAIVDAFDAMTNNRPYSKAKSIEKAVEEIKQCSGTRFDPTLVEVFFISISTRGSRFKL